MTTPKAPKSNAKAKSRKPLKVTPIDQIVADLVIQFDDDLREEFDERAAIIEFEGRIPRAHAECLALVDVLTRRPSVIVGVVAGQVRAKGKTKWFVTTSINEAQQQLSKAGAEEVTPCELAQVLDEHYGGMAILQPAG